jgi:hypothetical protein
VLEHMQQAEVDVRVGAAANGSRPSQRGVRSGRGAHRYCSLVHLPSPAGSALTFVENTYLRRARAACARARAGSTGRAMVLAVLRALLQ